MADRTQRQIEEDRELEELEQHAREFEASTDYTPEEKARMAAGYTASRQAILLVRQDNRPEGCPPAHRIVGFSLGFGVPDGGEADRHMEACPACQASIQKLRSWIAKQPPVS